MRRMKIIQGRKVTGEGTESPAGALPEMARIITGDAGLQETLARLPVFAAADLPVLITGEPGTGKELVAEALWSLSRRQRQRLYRINCSTLVESLAASELFGHVRGSFTDAYQARAGKFRLAHHGTLFLDEVGDLPLAIQPLLLRAVEHGEIEPVGADDPVQVDVRLLAATNQDLPRLMAQGLFRQDLYDRLAVLVINLPPLRRRGEDIALLAQHLVRKKSRCCGREVLGFTSGALRRLQEHPWPGNVRELENVITRAVLLTPGPLIREKDLTFLAHPPPGRQNQLPLPETGLIRPDRGYLERLLAEEGGNIAALARRLQVCTKTVYRWLKALQISPGPGRALGGAGG